MCCARARIPRRSWAPLTSWVEVWAAGGICEIEEYLAKHLAFLTYLDETA